MNKLYLSEEALHDLEDIKAYIEAELKNPSAARSTIRRITERLRILESYPFAGASLSSVLTIRSDYRFLVSGNYLIFYRVQENNIYIVRVINGRRNYMDILFGEQ